MEKNDILTRQKSAETKLGNKNKRNITHFTSHDVNFRCRCPAHSQAFSGPLYVGPGQNGRSLQTTTEPTYDYAFEVCKVCVFWEGHKNWPNLHRRFETYYIMSNRRWKFCQFFLGFLENMNFTKIVLNYEYLNIIQIKCYLNVSKHFTYKRHTFFQRTLNLQIDNQFLMLAYLAFAIGFNHLIRKVVLVN